MSTSECWQPNCAKNHCSKGEQGDKGIQGEQGDKGIQGAQGDKGIQGEQGDKGIQGEQGDKGIQGDQGKQGDKGDKGDQGGRGPIGQLTNNSIINSSHNKYSCKMPKCEKVINIINDDNKCDISNNNEYKTINSINSSSGDCKIMNDCYNTYVYKCDEKKCKKKKSNKCNKKKSYKIKHKDNSLDVNLLIQFVKLNPFCDIFLKILKNMLNTI